MSTAIWCEIVCDTCSASGPGMFAFGKLPTKLLKDKAQNAGWLFTQQNTYCCRYCKDNPQ